jgi:hypothetical protein
LGNAFSRLFFLSPGPLARESRPFFMAVLLGNRKTEKRKRKKKENL